MSLSKDTNLNLPKGILQLYQRRYSDPGPSLNKNLTVSSIRPRRFTLTTFHDLKDVSSTAVRNHINQVLKLSGYTACQQAKITQARRYSMHIDPEAENNLGENRQRRSSFVDKNVEILPSLYKKQKDSRFAQTGGRKGKGTNSGKNKTSCLNIRRKNSVSCWDEKELKEYQKHLHSHRPTPFNACDDEYWMSRKSKGVGDQTDDLSILPKCKYQLRPGGQIYSDIVSASGVQIQGMSDNDAMYSRNNNYNPDKNESDTYHSAYNRVKSSNSPDTETRPPSATSCLTTRNSINSQFRTEHIPFTKMAWEEEEDNFKYTFFCPSKQLIECGVCTTIAKPSKYTIKDTCELPKAALNTNKPLAKSQLHFEFIGNADIHGCPTYSGRLKLCTFRTVS